MSTFDETSKRPSTLPPAKEPRSRSLRSVTIENDIAESPAINSSVLRSATRRKHIASIKREHENIEAEESQTPKRPALGNLSSNNVRRSPKPSLVAKFTASSEMVETDAQIANFKAEITKLKESIAVQGYAYRGLQLEMDETKAEMADMEAKLNDSEARYLNLRASITKIQEVVKEYDM